MRTGLPIIENLSVEEFLSLAIADNTFTPRIATKAKGFEYLFTKQYFAQGMKTFQKLEELILVEEPFTGGRGPLIGLTGARFRADQLRDAESAEEKVVVRRRYMAERDRVVAEFVQKIRANMGEDENWTTLTVSIVSYEKFWNPHNIHQLPERCFEDEL